MKYFLAVLLIGVFFVCGCMQAPLTSPHFDSIPVISNTSANVPPAQQFNESQVLQACGQPNIEGVYSCQGNSYKIVSSLLGGGFRIVNPDFSIVSCPVVSPEYTTEECTKFGAESYCNTKNLCG